MFFLCCHCSLDSPDEVVDDEDDDVAEERERAMSGDAADDTLVLHELTKVDLSLADFRAIVVVMDRAQPQSIYMGALVAFLCSAVLPPENHTGHLVLSNDCRSGSSVGGWSVALLNKGLNWHFLVVFSFQL